MWLPGFTLARTFTSPCFGCKLKARVATYLHANMIEVHVFFIITSTLSNNFVKFHQNKGQAFEDQELFYSSLCKIWKMKFGWCIISENFHFHSTCYHCCWTPKEKLMINFELVIIDEKTTNDYVVSLLKSNKIFIILIN
jgi:hypothetical protein